MKGSILNDAVTHGAIIVAVMGIVLLSFHLLRLRLTKKHSCAKPEWNSRCTPGETHLAQIDALGAEIRVGALALILGPMLIFTAHITWSGLGRRPESWDRIAISCIGALVITVFISWKLISSLRQRRWVRLAYEGKVAAGQALNLLLKDGYRIFHDFPAENSSIDHLAVGPTGVMAVKTMIWPGVRTHGRDGDAVVRYDGRMLHFPKFSDFETLDQAKAQAEWLSWWLSDKVGEDVCARAMVVVPGWSVRRTSADGIPVVNPMQFENLFKFIKPRPMSELLIQRIVGVIDGYCQERAL